MCTNNPTAWGNTDQRLSLKTERKLGGGGGGRQWNGRTFFKSRSHFERGTFVSLILPKIMDGSDE